MAQSIEQPDDNELIARISQGDQEALTQLYERWSGTLKGIGLRIIKSEAEVEDIMHDVFLEIWRTSSDFDPGRGLARTWIVMKMRCRMIDRLRKHQRRGALQPVVEQVMQPSKLSADPSKAYAHAQLRAALDELSEPLRQVLHLTYFEHLSSTEVARRLDMPIGTVKSRIAAARRALKANLEDPKQGGAS